MDNNIKSGWKTTEFWTSIGTVVVGLGVLFGAFTPAEASDLMLTVSKVVGGLMAIVPTVGYALSRAKSKQQPVDVIALLDFLKKQGE